ncbi:MAG: hypothetical protein PHX61_02605 [Alphaproteobacteria bacterium]|nr:hypothetical protein [Alphaproteobacteria bacterium]
MKRIMRVLPIQNNQLRIETIGEHCLGEQVLPPIQVTAFPHTMEVQVTDLAGDPVHTIVIRQNGDVEVDP